MGKTSYHNTTDINGQVAIEFEHKAKNQEAAIWAVFREKRQDLTASEVWERLAFANWPLTSIRRGMSNLAKAGKLVKLKKTKEGIYGRPEHYYRTHHMSRKRKIK